MTTRAVAATFEITLGVLMGRRPKVWIWEGSVKKQASPAVSQLGSYQSRSGANYTQLDIGIPNEYLLPIQSSQI